MKKCTSCGAELDNSATVCPNCGAPVGVAAADTYDHTSEFTAKDISDNKVIAMAAYVLGFMGILLAVIYAKDSPYAAFHVRQSLKLTVLSTLIGMISSVLCWTFIVPVAGAVCSVIIFVLTIIAFFNVCNGQAKELPILQNLKFLK